MTPEQAAAAARVSDAAARRLEVLSRPDDPLLRELERMAELPWVESVLALPDLHQKPNAEVPSSIAVTTLDAIVPEFTSVAVNDGMGLVLTDLEAREVTPERALAFFHAMNGNAARHVLDRNRYSLTGEQMRRAALEGGPAGCAIYGHPRSLTDRMEWSGRLALPKNAEPWESFVPLLLRATALGRCEMGLNFGGNHFLEMQVVDRVHEPALAGEWGLTPNRVAVMYHLGPGPFGSILLHHFVRRKSLKGARAPFFFLSKLFHHYASGGRPGSLARRWDLHFKASDRTWFAPASEEGAQLRQALAMAANFGFVYRMATIAAIRDALATAYGRPVAVDLLCDVAHNSLTEEPWGDGTAWIARHNCCRLAPHAPAIVAGDHDVPSIIGRGGSDALPELHSYDHGAGSIIERWRSEGRLQSTVRTTERVRLQRGPGGRVLKHETVPVRTAAPIEELMDTLERHDIVHPVARMRPIATLKN
jgi:tRNA-splicing ligase RtcB